MTANFDPYDEISWDFGVMSREDATAKLMSENEAGVFLVRHSVSIQGDLVLCVREKSKVGHYIVNHIQQGGQIRYRIGDQMFPDMPALLSFFKLHHLDTTPLTKPDPGDLPFKKDEILTVIFKDEEKWWKAKNSLGEIGTIPVPYVEALTLEAGKLGSGAEGSPSQNLSSALQGSRSQSSPSKIQTSGDPIKYNIPANIQRKLPAMARVRQSKVPNAFDRTALKLEVGDIIKVTKMNINGQWEGELKGRTGLFPFTYVEFVDTENAEEGES